MKMFAIKYIEVLELPRLFGIFGTSEIASERPFARPSLADSLSNSDKSQNFH